MDQPSQVRKEQLQELVILREEIKETWNQTYTTLSFLLALIGLIVGSAYHDKANPLVVFPMASIISWGGYRLIFVHIDRVWRSVGYIRRVLEPNLAGIRWETRLAARAEATKGSKPLLDRTGLFDGQLSILDAANVAVLVGIVHAGYESVKVTSVPSINVLLTTITPSSISVLVPICVLTWSLLKRRSLRRGGSRPKLHLDYWDMETNGIKACDAEPPIDWRRE